MSTTEGPLLTDACIEEAVRPQRAEPPVGLIVLAALNGGLALLVLFLFVMGMLIEPSLVGLVGAVLAVAVIGLEYCLLFRQSPSAATMLTFVSICMALCVPLPVVFGLSTANVVPAGVLAGILVCFFCGSAMAHWRWRSWLIANMHHDPHRCPVCDYDLRGTPGRCPECGYRRLNLPDATAGTPL